MSKVKVMVVGGGGREHALCWKIAQSDLVESIYCAPGNGGTQNEAKVENLAISVDDFESLASACQERKIDLVVIGPDNPLADGIVDYLEEKGLTVFGPRKNSAKLESSKSHAKEVMTKIGIPTARYGVFTEKDEALKFAQENDWAKVVKADGLAYGKGVFVCNELKEVEAALDECFDKKSFGESGNTVLVEEKLDGEELSLFLLCDGKSVLTLAPSQDHKRRFEQDKGPNTGGMGAYSPVPVYEQYSKDIQKLVVEPIEKALQSGALDYKGVLFIGIMISNNTPYVLEFNARFGDPEAQTILPRLKSDIVPALLACTDQSLSDIKLEWHDKSSMCVVLSGKNYPKESSKGKLITIEEVSPDTFVFHAGTKIENEAIYTNGGRVIAVTGLGENIEEARNLTYKNLDKIDFADMDYRKDIGWRVITKCQSI